MKVLSYRGTSHVREISAQDMARSWDIKAPGISVDTRVTRLVTVSNVLAAHLIDTGEFVLIGDVGDDEVAEVSEVSEVSESAVPAAASLGEGESPSVVSVKEDDPPRDTDVATASSVAPAPRRQIKDQPQA